MIQARESRMPRNASCQKKLSFAEDTSSSSERVEDAISSDGVSDSKQHRDSSLPELAIDLLFEQKGASRTMIQEDWPNGAGPLGEQQSKKISGGTDGSALDDDAKSEREGSGSSTVAVEDRTRQNDGGFADENCNVNSNDGTSLRGMDPLAKALLAQTRAWEFFSPLVAKCAYNQHWVGTGEFATMEYTLAFVHGILHRASGASVPTEVDGLSPTLALTSLWLADIWATRNYELSALMDFYMMFHPNRKDKDEMAALSKDMQKSQVELLRAAKWSIWLKEEDLVFSIGCLRSVPWYQRVVKYIEGQARAAVGRKTSRVGSDIRSKREHLLSCKDGRGSFTLYTVASEQLLPSGEKVLDGTVYSTGKKRRLEDTSGVPVTKRQQSDADVNVSWRDALRILYEHWRDYIRMLLHGTGHTRQPE